MRTLERGGGGGSRLPIIDCRDYVCACACVCVCVAKIKMNVYGFPTDPIIFHKHRKNSSNEKEGKKKKGGNGSRRHKRH